MALSWTWKRRSKHGEVTKIEASRGIHEDMELTIPTHFRCPISLDLMKDPVTLSTGITYDRLSIEKWINEGNPTCPVTNQLLSTFDQIPNHTIRKIIQDWCVANKTCGVKRIPTPRIPITPNEVTTICARMEAATQRGDATRCRELLGKMDSLAKESESNKRCIMKNGIAHTLGYMFESFAHSHADSDTSLLKEILSTLTWASPLDQQGISKLKSEVSVRAMSRLLKCEDDLSLRQNAVSMLKEVVTMDQVSVESLMGVEDIEETLFHIVKDPISPKATKATLVIIRHIVSSSPEHSVAKFVRMGLIPLILQLLVNCDKSLCEKALAIIDSICSKKEGREIASNNALTIPLLVKKILRVSNTATEICVSNLWKLCFGENKDALFEAIQFGAFQKLLVVLQIDISVGTKEKVTELLKLINLHRHKFDCLDSSLGFRYFKRSNDL